MSAMFLPSSRIVFAVGGRLYRTAFLEFCMSQPSTIHLLLCMHP